MARHLVHRSDANAQQIRHYLEKHVASVVPIGQPVDWAVGYRGLTALVEIKTPTGRLRMAQVEFLSSFRGLVLVVRTEQQAKALLGHMARISQVWTRNSCGITIRETER